MALDSSKSDIVISLLHDDEPVGMLWRKFMEEMLTVKLPENYRDMGLDVECVCVTELDQETISYVSQCAWKLLLLSHPMLDEVKDQSSSLMRSGLLTTDADRVIVLILAEQDDTNFLDDVRRSLCLFREFPKFHLVYATSPSKIFNDVIEIVSPLYVVFHPNVISSKDNEQHLTLIANKAYPSIDGATFKVEFDDDGRKIEVEARLFNSCTLLLQNPGNLPTGMLDVKLYVCVPHNDGDVLSHQLGDQMKVWIQSDLDRLNSILERSNEPFSFLCQVFKVDPHDPSAVDIVDKHLTDSFRKHVPENQLTRVFGTDQGFNPDAVEEKRRELAPTLLHFAAMHGLRNLTAQLLRCPGAVRAYGMANCDGDYPTTLAEKGGHWDLKNYMTSYMEVSAMVDYEMGYSRNTSEMMARMVTGEFLPINETEYDQEQTSSNSTPGYVAMRPLRENYDSPFIVPIPFSDDTPEYESVLVQMIESEDTYMSFPENGALQYSFGEGYGKDAPPPPPRDATVPPPPRDLAAPPPDIQPALPPRRVSDDVTALPPPPPPIEQSDPSIRRGGADRVSYGSLSMPKVHSHVSPAQRELITLQQKVKNRELTTNQAVVRFREWERKHKEQAASFQFQQECLQRIRNSLMKSKELKRANGEDDEIEITKPIIAGSSTYDLVLKKTNVSDPSEVIYGSTKPPKMDDGFCRTSSRSADSGLESGTFSSHYSKSTTNSNSQVKAAANLYTSRNPSRDDGTLSRPPPPVPPREHTQTTSLPAPYIPPRSYY